MGWGEGAYLFSFLIYAVDGGAGQPHTATSVPPNMEHRTYWTECRVAPRTKVVVGEKFFRRPAGSALAMPTVLWYSTNSFFNESKI